MKVTPGYGAPSYLTSIPLTSCFPTACFQAHHFLNPRQVLEHQNLTSLTYVHIGVYTQQQLVWSFPELSTEAHKDHENRQDQ